MIALTIFLVFISLAAQTLLVSATTPFNITAISSRNGYSVLECWQLASIPVEARSAMNYDIGNTTLATWSAINPRTEVGQAWAPHVQLSIILNGLIRITSPAPLASSSASTTTTTTTTNESAIPSASVLGGSQQSSGQNNGSDASQRPETKVAYIMPGTTKSSVLIAADLKSISTVAGHYTEFPSDEPTILVQIPFVDDKAPEHTVLYEGACV
ncbi:hypothetical protein B0T19DRAFT_439755 [Cercophora scortea]|uniref:Uncharacterized protein n=1 Tax=Cercophora scortea TaxID=314031 RepID=A0AAE0IXE6_9PEZI|nr:hypothetical protein B0T19DRAFT_439755 [Cercophora scortea]